MKYFAIQLIHVASLSFKTSVAKYEVLMKEHDANMMTEERSHLLFQVFDNLIPHLGVFKPVMLKLRDELYGTCLKASKSGLWRQVYYVLVFSDFVFSDEHHTARASRMTNVSGSRSRASPSVKVERVPHYVLLKKLLQSRDNQADDLSTQVDTLQETLVLIIVCLYSHPPAILLARENRVPLFLIFLFLQICDAVILATWSFDSPQLLQHRLSSSGKGSYDIVSYLRAGTDWWTDNVITYKAFVIHCGLRLTDWQTDFDIRYASVQVAGRLVSLQYHRIS